jgi:subtilisin-like proprotein convertase family protein
MKMRSHYLAAAILALSCNSHADFITASRTVNTLIPDNDLSGLASTISIGNISGPITSIVLTLNLGGTPSTFNGDYYAYLTHGSTLVTLLNNVGEPGLPFGYSDNGFDVTLKDSALNIHNYQNYNYAMNPNQQLTGIWAPDGGALSLFDDQNAAGNWTLFIADTSPGGTAYLNNWSLEVTTFVPESGSSLVLLTLSMVAIGLGKHSARILHLQCRGRL